MKCTSPVLWLSLAASLGACSLINAPAEIDRGGTAGSGAATGGSGGGGSPCVTEADCPEPAACTVALCKAGVCAVDQAPNNTPCDDGRFCTDDDLCASGQCTAGVPHPCTALDECHTSICDEAAVGCVEALKRDGAICDDGNACTASSTCSAGVCVGGPECIHDECSTSVCDPLVGCTTTPLPVGTLCGNTFCATGACDGVGKCTIMAQNVGFGCDDGQFCTINDVCSPVGLCIGEGTPCMDPAACVKASCNEAEDKCDFTSILAGETCEDGDACTGGETCDAAAQCAGAQSAYLAFYEDFANGNLAGWDVGKEWGIGPAQASMTGSVCCDPGVDFDGDGNIAGVVIGGNASIELSGDPPSPVHPFYYLTSPPVDTLFVPGPLYLTYYRWLLSDYPEFMHNTVEVSADGGASWFVVWSYDLGVVANDGAWTFQTHDLTPYKSATMLFRFGFDIGQMGVYEVGSWNLDHIKLQNTRCPK